MIYDWPMRLRRLASALFSLGGAGLVIAAACYRPSAVDCAYTCGGATGLVCPNGLACDGEGYCRTPELTIPSCRDLPQRDAPTEPDDATDAPGGCTVASFPASNFDEFAQAGTDDIAVLNTVTFNTDNPSLPAGPNLITQGDTLIARIASITISASGRWQIRGNRRLVVFADSITVEAGGVIEVENAPRTCVGAAAKDGVGGGGGGGGGFASTGGNGGGTEGGEGGKPRSTPENVPLVSGCAGGAGAMSSSGMARGGDGGGALQLTARRMIMNGQIVAFGKGGASAASSTGGGGGGGAGGAIIVEGCSVELGPVHTLCATGGGGGAVPVMGTSIVDENDGTCTAGGIGTPGLAAGGNGASNGAGSNGGASMGTLGGGGGGAAGRIVVRGRAITGTANGLPTAVRTVVPPP